MKHCSFHTRTHKDKSRWNIVPTSGWRRRIPKKQTFFLHHIFSSFIMSLSFLFIFLPLSKIIVWWRNRESRAAEISPPPSPKSAPSAPPLSSLCSSQFFFPESGNSKDGLIMIGVGSSAQLTFSSSTSINSASESPFLGALFFFFSRPGPN